MPVIDVHVHVVDPALARRTAGRTVMGGWGSRSLEPFDPSSPRARLLAPMSDPALALDGMDRMGVDRFVLSSSMVAQNSDWADPGEQEAFERDANDYVAGWVAAHPERFTGLATLPLKDPRRAVAELDRAVGLGLRGIALPALADGDYLGAPRFERSGRRSRIAACSSSCIRTARAIRGTRTMRCGTPSASRSRRRGSSPR